VETKNTVEPFFYKFLIGNLRGCKVNDYLQLEALIFYTLYLTSFSYESDSQDG